MSWLRRFSYVAWKRSNLPLVWGCLTAWKTFLDAHGLPTNPKRHIGPRITLEPREKLRVAHVNGDPVVPRAEVVKLIRESPALYADAEELLAS